MTTDEILRYLGKRYESVDPAGFDYFDYLYSAGSPFSVWMYARLFCPNFVEIQGMVFLEETIDCDEARARLKSCLVKYDGDQTKTEQAFNVIEVPHLFDPRIPDIDHEQYKFVAETLVKTWFSQLRAQFPTYSFCVEMLTSEETGDGVGIWFYQLR